MGEMTLEELKHVNDQIGKRRWAYPPVEDQLDMLWHAMDADPSKRLEPFYTTIKTIKDQFSKSFPS
jgi:hypothetical protein